MTPVHAQELEPQPSGMGEFSRLTGVFFEPGKTFKDIAERPRWIVPLLLLMLMTVCYLSVIGHKIGWETVVTQQMEARMATMSDQQRTAMQNNMQTYVRFGAAMAYGAGLLGMPLYFLASAGVLMLIVNAFMSAGLRFKQIFAIVCYAGLPGLIHSAAARPSC